MGGMPIQCHKKMPMENQVAQQWRKPQQVTSSVEFIYVEQLESTTPGFIAQL